jgi:hypothetical protein
VLNGRLLPAIAGVIGVAILLIEVVIVSIELIVYQVVRRWVPFADDTIDDIASL